MEFDATFLIAVISFVVFTVIMNKIFYAPILKIMQERQNIVEDNYRSAKDTKAETEKKKDYHTQELENTRDEARLKVSSATKEFKQAHSKEISEYKETVFGKVSEERENLKNSAIEAKEVLKDNIVDIAKEISSVLLGNDINSVSINKSQIKEEQG